MHSREPSSSPARRTPSPARLHLWLIIFLVGLLATVKVWDHYFNSTDPLDRTFVSNLILLMGTLFSFATSYFIWTLEAGRNFLEKEVKRRSDAFLEKEKEAIAAEARSREARRKQEEVETAYENLQKAQQQLIQAEKLASMGRVITGIVHELKTPLITIFGYSKIMLQESEGGENGKRAEIIRRQAERCLGTVQRLLTFSRDEKPKLESVCLQTVLARTLEELPLEFKQENIRILRQCPLEKVILNSDPARLQDLFNNLLVNSWHAFREVTGREKKISIRLSSSSDFAQLFFTDNGSGIPKENLDRIFEPFFTTKPAGEGTGLGLSLCYGIVSMLGGRISVQSEEGKGTTFLVELPRNPAPHGPAPETRAKERKRILVVDDERSVAKFLEMAFEKLDYEVITFESGKEILGFLQEGRQAADLIILDINLPGMDGFEIARHLRASAGYAATPIIFLTAREEEQDKVLAGRLAERFLHKPFNYQDLEESVSQLLHK